MTPSSPTSPAPTYSLALVARLTREHGAARLNFFTKTFVDALSHPANASTQRQRAMIEEEPQLLDEPWINALLAGIAEFIANREDFEPPAWTHKPERFLPQPLFWGVLPATRAHMLAETPGPFRRRNLFCGYIHLHTPRWGPPPDA
ncbi:MAG: hypothetical protein RMK34_01690 [Tepidimonas sp.]|uniref:hypothetical protein n=1 Tax=Tepidimonas sp. TaxID=2002775 RepID=UPI00298EF73C|nr:hypothetical protein [Tepidimonas sp.]MDW8335662.1 hypothetical protein [Tepidimonas sp.]